MSRFGLRKKLRAGLKRAMGSEPARAFDDQAATAWQSMSQDYRAAYVDFAQAIRVGWDTVEAELEVAIQATQDDAVAAQLSGELKAALKPMTDVFDEVSARSEATWAAAGEAAQASGQVADATDPVVAESKALAAAIAEAWDQTVALLMPVLDKVQMEQDDRDKLIRYRQKLTDALAGGADTLSARLLDLRRAPELVRTTRDALEEYRSATAQKLEVLLDGVKQIIVEAAWLSGRKADS